MPVHLENLSDRPVVLLLSSGDTLRLSPGDRSDALTDAEVNANPKVGKLAAKGVIALHETPRRSSADKATKASKKRGASEAAKPAKPTKETAKS